MKNSATRTATSQSMTRLIAAAATLCCAGAANAQSSVTIYGIVDAAVVITSNQAGGTKTAVDAGQLATSRWGFKGTEDLGGGLKANFALESTLANDTGAGGSSFGTPAQATMFDRISTVGLSGAFGSVDLGRQNMLGVGSVGLADPTGLAHAGTNPNVLYSALNSSALFGLYGTNGGGTALRQNNSIKYVTPVMSGFIGAAMYGFGEQAGNTSANTYKGLSGTFTDGISGVAIAYAKLRNTADTDTLTLIGGGAKYVMNPFTLKLTYVQSEADLSKRKIAVIGAGVDYALSPALTLTAAYYNTKQSGSPALEGKADQYIAMAKYALSKRTTAYASLTYAKAGSATNPSDLAMASGLVGNGNDTATRTTIGVMHTF